MRKIIVITQVTLDGVMQAPGGLEEDPSNGFTHGGWVMAFVDDALSQVIGEAIAGFLKGGLGCESPPGDGELRRDRGPAAHGGARHEAAARRGATAGRWVTWAAHKPEGASSSHGIWVKIKTISFCLSEGTGASACGATKRGNRTIVERDLIRCR